MKQGRFLIAGTMCVIALLYTPPTHGILLYGTSDPNANTTAPTGTYLNSGWDYQGEFGRFLGTAISVTRFITAKHIITVPNNGLNLDANNQPTSNTKFKYRGVQYTVIARVDHPSADITVWQVSGTLPAYANIYPYRDHTALVDTINTPSIPKEMVAFGRGAPRGNAVYSTASVPGIPAGTLRGWYRQPQEATPKTRWGVSSYAQGLDLTLSSAYAFITTPFAANSPNSFDVSEGDSGGGLFGFDKSGEWKLMGIANSRMQIAYLAPNTTVLDAAIFDTRGLYLYDLTSGYYVSDNNSYYQTAGNYVDLTQTDNYSWILKRVGKLRLREPETFASPVGSSFNFVIMGDMLPGAVTVEYSSDLSNWSTLTTLNVATGEYQKSVLDSTVSNVPRRFYRFKDSGNRKSENAIGFNRTQVGSTTGTSSWKTYFGMPFLNTRTPSVIFLTPQIFLAPSSPSLPLPEDTVIWRNDLSGSWSYSMYNQTTTLFGDLMLWSDMNYLITYGSGYLIELPPATLGSINLFGEVATTFNVTVQPGWNPLMTLPKCVSGTVGAAFGFSPLNGDKVQRLTSGGSTTISTFSSPGGVPTWTPSFTLSPGEGFMYYSTSPTSRQWTYSWSIW